MEPDEKGRCELKRALLTIGAYCRSRLYLFCCSSSRRPITSQHRGAFAFPCLCSCTHYYRPLSCLHFFVPAPCCAPLLSAAVRLCAFCALCIVACWPPFLSVIGAAPGSEQVVLASSSPLVPPGDFNWNRQPTTPRRRAGAKGKYVSTVLAPLFIMLLHTQTDVCLHVLFF